MKSVIRLALVDPNDVSRNALKTLLLAKSPDLCTSCHKPLKERIATEKAHPPVDDCLTCHAPHHSAQPKLATQPLGELCGNCHDAKEKGFQKAHLAIEPAAIDCMSCHDPHASKDPKFFKAKVHAPFAARECEACHVTEKKK